MALAIGMIASQCAAKRFGALGMIGMIHPNELHFHPNGVLTWDEVHPNDK